MSNPLLSLGLRRKDEVPPEEPEEPQDQPRTSKGGLQLNNRGIPARKRKLNSLIYGTDDMVSIPIKSPKKRGPKTPSKISQDVSKVVDPIETIENFEIPDDVSEISEKIPSQPASPVKSPTKSPVKSAVKRRLLTASNAVVKTAAVKKLNLNKTPKSTKKANKVAVQDLEPVTPNVKSEIFDPELSSPEKKSAQKLGVALRNLLKLPKGHKWVCYEFFYSNLDQVLFEGENDFMVCLKESFPQLKTRRLTRVEWCKVRRLMGKPRRCSSAFFAEERAELARKRQKIRMLQQRKQLMDYSTFKDLPESMPLLLTIGARVTARLRKPQDGLFMGTVDAYDTSNNTYRIRFDREALGTLSVPDEDVVSAGELETLPLSTFTVPKPRPTRPVEPDSPKMGSMSSSVQMMTSFSPQVQANDPLLSGRSPMGKYLPIEGNVGGYPIKFLEQIVRLSKCLKKKRELIGSLRDLNAQGEKKKSHGVQINEDFQRRYASNVLELSQVNRDLNEHLKNIQEFTQEFAPEVGPTISLPNIIREGCQEDAYDMVNKNNTTEEKECVDSPKVLSLVSSLTSLMCILHRLADGERNAYEVQALKDSLLEIKQNLSPKNLSKFENDVEVHMQHIQTGLSQMGNLKVFMKTPTAVQTTLQQTSSSKIKVVPTVRLKSEKPDPIITTDR